MKAMFNSEEMLVKLNCTLKDALVAASEQNWSMLQPLLSLATCQTYVIGMIECGGVDSCEEAP